MIDRAGAHRPVRVIEIVGPTGAGKTTLSSLLAQSVPQAKVGLRLSSWRLLPLALRGGAASLPALLSGVRSGRGFTREMAARMAYLQAHLRAVRHHAARQTSLLVLDQGPVYKLAELCEFDPTATHAPGVGQWWAQMVRQWAGTLDLVISLDAPDEVLMQRIQTRPKAHQVTQVERAEAQAYLARYRDAVHEIVGQMASGGGPAWIQVRTDQQPLDETVRQTLDALELLQGRPLSEARPVVASSDHT